MKEIVTVSMGESWNHSSNRSGDIIDMIETDSGRIVDFEIIEGRNH
jgi:hypothetical protein